MSGPCVPIRHPQGDTGMLGPSSFSPPAAGPVRAHCPTKNYLKLALVPGRARGQDRKGLDTHATIPILTCLRHSVPFSLFPLRAHVRILPKPLPRLPVAPPWRGQGKSHFGEMFSVRPTSCQPSFPTVI